MPWHTRHTQGRQVCLPTALCLLIKNQLVLRTRLFRAQNLNDLLPKINLFLLVALSYDRTTVFQICTHIFKCQMQILHFSNFDLRSIHRPVASGVGRPPLFDRSVNPISTRRAHYSHPVLRAPPPGFSDLAKALIHIIILFRGIKSLGGHFACLCRGFGFSKVKKKKIVIIFQKLLHFLSFL